MCGIVAVLGRQSALPVLLAGLQRLEYRGYDSAGVALVGESGGGMLCREVGQVKVLESACARSPLLAAARTGVGHTRWATHGAPSERNAHPHVDASGRFALVHNGVLENASAIQSFLEGEGVSFQSETDTEALVQLIGYEVRARALSPWDAFRAGLQASEGALAVALVDFQDPGVLFVARRGSPLLIGRGEIGWVATSDPAALAGVCDEYVVLGDGECARLRDGEIEVSTFASEPVGTRFEPLAVTIESIELGAHQDFMHKEIHEQPRALRRCLAGRVRDGVVHLEGLRTVLDAKRVVNRALLFGCGTAWHAGLVGEYLLEELARIPCRVDYASELRYRNPLVEFGTLAIAVSQSGETADTLEALREVRRRGAVGFGVVNVAGSSITRETEAGAYLHAGPEIGVASTKAFTAQVTVLAMVAAGLAQRSGHSAKGVSEFLDSLTTVPELIERALRTEEVIHDLAELYADAPNWLFLGRGINYPVALEGALKLKEISYRHAEGMPAAEIKHGPLALVEEGMPVVVVAPDDHTAPKVVANVQQVRSRGARVIAIVTEGDQRLAGVADHLVEVPRTHPLLSPLVTAVPLQFLAYSAARVRGLDVDRPRNLAKSVTVE